MAERIASIDILRGIAVLQMIFWQIFDFFAKIDIYWQPPYYFSFFNMPINGIGLALFAFASGASVYISITRRLKNKISIRGIALHSIKRYGGYILLSLVFTSLVFGFKVFYEWREAVQGIGFAALVAALLILVSQSKWFYLILAGILACIQPFLRAALGSSFIATNFPLEPVSSNIMANSISLLLNATIRGFFSLTHALPMLLFGVMLSAIIAKSSGKSLIKTAFLTGIIMSLVSLAMHFTFNKIDVYNWSPAYLIGFTGFSFLLFSVIEYLLQRFGKSQISGFLSLFGKTAIIAYLFHFVVVYYPLKVFKLENTLNQPVSYLLAVICVIITYYSCKAWLLNKKLIFNKIRNMHLFKPILR